jgi:hypothetical protein
MASIATVALVVLGALPLFFGVRAASRDPVFSSLDALDVPQWAAADVEDLSSGSRWCFFHCRLRERTAQSARPQDQTASTYQDALTAAGWQRWKVERCPEQPVDGSYSCWRRDEFTLDLWVHKPACAADALNPRTATPGAVAPDPATCVGATVSIKVQNAVDDDRSRPAPAPDPSLIGETPDVVITNDVLPEATPSPS